MSLIIPIQLIKAVSKDKANTATIQVISQVAANLPSPAGKKASVNAKSNLLKTKFKINMILENLTSLTIPVSTANIRTPKLDKKSIRLKLKKYLPKKLKIKSAKLIKSKKDESETN